MIGVIAVRSLAKLTAFACGAVAVSLISLAPLQAEEPTLNDLKGKLFDARMAVKTFANGLPFCNELDGTNFFFEPRRRVLNLEEYHHSLENLVQAHAFNPETKRPWSPEDAAARWEQVKKEAVRDQENCNMVRTLPELERRVKDLETKAGTKEH